MTVTEGACLGQTKSGAGCTRAAAAGDPHQRCWQHQVTDPTAKPAASVAPQEPSPDPDPADTATASAVAAGSQVESGTGAYDHAHVFDPVAAVCTVPGCQRVMPDWLAESQQDTWSAQVSGSWWAKVPSSVRWLLMAGVVALVLRALMGQVAGALAPEVTVPGLVVPPVPGVEAPGVEVPGDTGLPTEGVLDGVPGLDGLSDLPAGDLTPEQIESVLDAVSGGAEP